MTSCRSLIHIIISWNEVIYLSSYTKFGLKQSNLIFHSDATFCAIFLIFLVSIKSAEIAFSQRYYFSLENTYNWLLYNNFQSLKVCFISVYTIVTFSLILNNSLLVCRILVIRYLDILQRSRLAENAPFDFKWVPFG